MNIIEKLIPSKYKSYFKNVHIQSFHLFFIQIVGTFLIFLSNILLAKGLGELQYGIYSVIMNWVSIIIVFAQMGMDDYHVSVLPGLNAQKKYADIKFLFRWSVTIVLLVTILVSVIVYFFIKLFHIGSLNIYNEYILLGLLNLCFLAIHSNNIGFLRGLKNVHLGQIIDNILKPIVFIVLIVIIYFVASSSSLGIYMWTMIVSSLISLILSFFFVTRHLNLLGDSVVRSKVDTRLKRNFHFILMSLLSILSLRIDILLISIYKPAIDVGHYNVAAKLADMSGYFISIINLLWPAYLAEYIYTKSKKETYQFIQTGAKLAFVATILFILLLFLFGDFLLNLYGSTFKVASLPLLILCLSKLPLAFIGPINARLMTEGKEKFSVFCMIIHVLFISLVASFLIEPLGLYGAALSVLIGNIFYSIVLTLVFYRLHKVIITPFKVFNFKHTIAIKPS